MTAIWSSTCKLRKPAAREEKGVGLSDAALRGVRASAPRVAPGTVSAGDQGENQARGDALCVPTSRSCSNEMEAKKEHCHLEDSNTLMLL